MNDDPRLPELDDRLLDAVSALVDDAADADERALVAASPDAQRWVEHLRALRDEVAGLAMVAPPAAAREAAFAAALAAFDELQQVTSTTPGAAVPATEIADTPAHEHRLHAAVSGATERITSLAEHRRRRSRWLLSAAAAVVVVAGVGIGIQANRQSDDEAADSAAMATEAPAAKEETGGAAGEVDDGAAERSVPAPMAADADAPAGAEPAEATEAATEAGDAVAEDATAMEALPSTIGSIDNPASVGVVIVTEDELASFVADGAAAYRTTEAPDETEAPAETQAPAETRAPAATEAPTDTEAAGAAESDGGVVSCVGDTQVFIGAISFAGTQAIAVYDPSTDAAIAYDAVDCSVLASVGLD